MSNPYRSPVPEPGFQHTNGLAVTSLVLGIVSWFAWFIIPLLPGLLLAPLGIIFGHLARGQIARSGGDQTGEGLALAGLIVSYIHVALAALFILLAIVLFFVMGVALFGISEAM